MSLPQNTSGGRGHCAEILGVSTPFEDAVVRKESPGKQNDVYRNTCSRMPKMLYYYGGQDPVSVFSLVYSLDT